ncbi:hypothetical protein XHV734_4974 [Xanthomonas hortorum pv. vitians]|nr:hypothetical protein XHV734_4974 [Xanthomonas hortorum pv. vitians]
MAAHASVVLLGRHRYARAGDPAPTAHACAAGRGAADGPGHAARHAACHVGARTPTTSRPPARRADAGRAAVLCAIAQWTLRRRTAARTGAHRLESGMAADPGGVARLVAGYRCQVCGAGG